MNIDSLGPANLHFDGEHWLVRASAVLGASHQRKDTLCQDAFAAWSQGQRCIAVVADGAGSASKGGDGAVCAARLIVTQLKARSKILPASEAIKTALYDAREILLQDATLSGEKLQSFATTIVGVLLQGSRGMFFHLGDGLALAFGKDTPHTVRAISRGTPSEFANVSSFLTDLDWEQNIIFTPIRSASSVMLMTDGFSPFAVGNDGEPKPRFYEPILNFLENHSGEIGIQALADLMDQDVVRKNSGDDCTLLWAGRYGHR